MPFSATLGASFGPSCATPRLGAQSSTRFAMSSIAQHGAAIGFRDPKRYGWWLSLFLPLLIWVGPLIYLKTGRLGGFWLVLAVYYIVIPLADFIVGRDSSNPPPSAFESLERDLYYRALTWLIVPFL